LERSDFEKDSFDERGKQININCPSFDSGVSILDGQDGRMLVRGEESKHASN